MFNKPKVSVIIPTYNRVSLLKEALNSVINQTYSHWECIIVNDYPPHKQLIEEIVKKLDDDRFILVNHEISQGGNEARNTGIKNSQGEIIAFLDDDDIWNSKKLERHCEFHQNCPEIGLFYSQVRSVWLNNELPSISSSYSASGKITNYFLEGKFCPMTSSSVTTLSRVFNDCGLFDPKLQSFQDWDMWCRISQKYHIGLIDKELVYFRHHLSERTSVNLQKRLKGLEQIINKWRNEIPDISSFRNQFTSQAYLNFTKHLCLIRNTENNLVYASVVFKYISQEYKCSRSGFRTLIILLLYPLIPRHFYFWRERHKNTEV